MADHLPLAKVRPCTVIRDLPLYNGLPVKLDANFLIAIVSW